jgi:hypothetical protein
VTIESQCALCHRPATLQRSHILPECLYDSVYDEQHRFLQTSTDPADRILSRPTGLYEQLLCGDCEGRLGVWETYGCGVLKGGIELRIQPEAWGFTVHGVDYARLKLFGMSLLWRAAVSRRPEFSAVQLDRHEEILRQMLAAARPGRPQEYGFSIVFVPEPRALELFSHTMSPPQPSRYGAHHVYRFLLGATIWLFFVSSHMDQLDESTISLSDGGLLRVRSGGQATLDFLRRFAIEVVAANEARRRE